MAVSLLVCIYCSPLAFARLRARFLLLFLRCLVGLPDSRKPISWGVRLSNPQDRWVESILQANYTGYFLWIRCGAFDCKCLLTSSAAFSCRKVIHSTRERIGFCLGGLLRLWIESLFAQVRRSSINAFCACRRFSASSHMTLPGSSIRSAVISSPRCAGRQCIYSASGAARSSSARLS